MSTVDTVGGQTAIPMPVDQDEALWASLTRDADAAEGHELQRDKTVLIGVPFVITGVAVRPGTPRPDGSTTNYVSAEVVVAPQSVIGQRVKNGRLSIEAAQRVTPLESLVINDGSTGFCRQIAQYLEDKGKIVLPDGPAAGPDGESKYDSFYESWTIVDGQRQDNGHVHFVVSLLCPRGLRVSEYPNPNNPRVMAQTFYLG